MCFGHWLALILFIKNKVILYVSVISLRIHPASTLPVKVNV